MNLRYWSPKEVAEADNITKFIKDLYKFSGQWVHDKILKGTGRDVPPNIPDTTTEHESNGPQRFILQGSQYLTK